MTRRTRHIPENQQQLPFRRNRGGVWTQVAPLERHTILALGLLIVVLSAGYVYFVMSSVMHVAAREALAVEATKRSAEVARLEATYLSRTENITESYARERGFVSIGSRSFVEQSTSVSLNN